MARLASPRILPLTISVMVLLLAAKAATFASEVGAAIGLTPAAIAHVSPAAARPGPVTSVIPAGRSAVKPEGDADVEAKERLLLLELGKRREALDAREHALDERDAVLEATELRLQTKIDHLTALQARINGLEASSKRRRAGDWQGLVKVYEAMKPSDAATIFDVLDMHVLLQVLDRMKVRKAAAVLAGMQPERARLATQMLAEMRQRRDLLISASSN